MLAALCPAAFVALLYSYALGPFFPAVAADLGTTVAVVGQVPALLNGLAGVLGLLAGPLADRYGYRQLLAAGVVAAAVGALGTGLATTLGLLLVATLFGALSRAAVAPVALTIAGTRFDGDARRRALSYVVAGLSGSAILGIPVLTGVEAAAGSWRAPFMALALVALAVVAAVLLLVPPDAPSASGRGLAGTFGVYGPLLRDAPTLGVVGSSFLRNTFVWMLGTYWGAFLIEHHGLSTQEAGLGYTAVGLGHFVGSLVAGRVRPWLPLRGQVGVLIAAAGALFTTSLLQPGGPAVSIACVFVAMLAMGGVDAANAALLSAEAPGGRATAMTLNQSAQSFGTAAGSALGGLLLASGGYGALGLGLPPFIAAAVACLWLSRRRVAAAVPAAR